jgi:cytochrome b561
MIDTLTRSRWSSTQIAIHWLTLLLILGLAIVGLTMGDLPNGPTKIKIYALHKSIGLCVIALTVLRLIIRLLVKSPPAIESIPAWQRWSAQAVHTCIYLLLLAIPFSGWLYNSASGFPLQWFGLFKVPALSGYNPGLKEIAHDAHETLFYLLALLIIAHASAALWHHYGLKDATLQRMLPWLKLEK